LCAGALAVMCSTAVRAHIASVVMTSAEETHADWRSLCELRTCATCLQPLRSMRQQLHTWHGPETNTPPLMLAGCHRHRPCPSSVGRDNNEQQHGVREIAGYGCQRCRAQLRWAAYRDGRNHHRGTSFVHGYARVHHHGDTGWWVPVPNLDPP
jgi:hypothetical protein